MKKVFSKDGTEIAYDQAGSGPAVILVASALSDHSETVKLAALLAEHFTVINYDRRGRGASGDTAPYAIEREIEDIEALVDAVGGPAYVFGSSSGAVLALDAANQLNGKIAKVTLYEPPFIIDDSRPPVTDDLIDEVAGLLVANRRSDVVKVFMSKILGVPAIGVFTMRLFPMWAKMKNMAHTLIYDLAITKGAQDGKPLPAERWASLSSSTLVLTGEKSEAFFHNGARALVDLLPNAEHRILEGQHHGSVVMSPKVIAGELVAFFRG